MAVTLAEVAEVYIATFNRAPDTAGLEYWAKSGLTIEEISESFFHQQETKLLYPDSMNNEELINTIYQNLFNRNADEAGMTYWAEQLDSGAVARDDAIIAIIHGAQEQDKVILDNKTEVGLYFAAHGEDLSIKQAYGVMEDVDGTQKSVDSAEHQVDEWNEDPVDPVPVDPVPVDPVPVDPVDPDPIGPNPDPDPDPHPNAPDTTISGINISDDTGSVGDDFITNKASQIITATLSAALVTGEKLWGSVNNGVNWVDITDKVNGTDISWDGATLDEGEDYIEFTVSNIAGPGPYVTQIYSLDTKAPTVTEGPAIADDWDKISLEVDETSTAFIYKKDGITPISITHLSENTLGDIIGDIIVVPQGADGVLSSDIIVEDLAGNETTSTTVILGTNGADLLRGSNEADLLYGFNGIDILDGGGGNDQLRGGLGTDFLTGGDGADIFVFGAGDSTQASTTKIVDFSNDQTDKINFVEGPAGTDSNYKKVDGSHTADIDEFLEHANATFDKTVLYYVEFNVNNTAYGYIAYDSNGDGIYDAADAVVLLNDVGSADIDYSDII